VGPLSTKYKSNPIELHTTNNKKDNFNISQSVKVYQVLLIYWYLSLSGYQVLFRQSQEAYQVLEFLEMFLTYDPTQSSPIKPNPTQPNALSVGRPNPWTILTSCVGQTIPGIDPRIFDFGAVAAIHMSAPIIVLAHPVYAEVNELNRGFLYTGSAAVDRQALYANISLVHSEYY